MDIQELSDRLSLTDIEILVYYDEPQLIKCTESLLGIDSIIMLVDHSIEGKSDERYIKFTPSVTDLNRYLCGEIDLLELINLSSNYTMIYGKSITELDEIPSKYLPDEGFYNIV